MCCRTQGDEWTDGHVERTDVSAFVVLVSGELDAEIEHQTTRDSTTGPEKPMGQRGAKMADTLGEKR